MTKPEAVSTAQGAATRFAKPFVVYRLPAWPADSFGVIAVDRGLPPEAQIVERFEPFNTPLVVVEPQGSLF